MLITNILNLNSRQLSYYPFDLMSSLALDNMIFPARLIKSLNVQVESAVFPLLITSVETDTDKSVLLYISDALDTLIGYIKLLSMRGKVVDTLGRLIGNICFLNELYSWLYKIVNDTLYKRILLLPLSLIIASLCVTCVHYTGFKGVSVNGTYIGNQVTLNFLRNVKTLTGTDWLSLSLCADYVDIGAVLSPVTMKLTYIIQMNDKDVTDKALIIKHRNLSDIRVKTLSDKISFIGVRDVV